MQPEQTVWRYRNSIIIIIIITCIILRILRHKL